jgi:hypothetical protein
MAAGFPAKTSFTDGSVLPASDLNDLGGTLNKIYNTAGYPQQLSFVSTTDSVLRPIPFATSTDRVTYTNNISAGAGVGVSMTFGSSVRFTVSPIVTVSAELTPTTAYASNSVHSVSTSGFSIRIFNVGSSTITNTYFHYHAIQMKATQADNN